jgi:enamine deaminase RidA (YjgF/YER057c/UK114 family)
MTLKLANPTTVAAPLGLYSHSVETPPGRGLIYVSGQVPVRPDGSLAGTSMAEQADQVYANIVAVLAAQGAPPSDIVKLTTFMTEDDPDGAVRAARRKHLGDHRPASTAVWVSRLVDLAWKIEIDAVALAPEGAP